MITKRSSGRDGVSGPLGLYIDNYLLDIFVDNNEAIRFYAEKYQDDGSCEGR